MEISLILSIQVHLWSIFSMHMCRHGYLRAFSKNSNIKIRYSIPVSLQ